MGMLCPCLLYAECGNDQGMALFFTRVFPTASYRQSEEEIGKSIQERGDLLVKKKLAKALICMFAVIALCTTAFAETSADLAARFGEGTIEKDGTVYRQRKRLSSTLIVCTETIEDVATPGFMCVLSTEDNEKTISVFYLDTRVLALEEGNENPETLSELFMNALPGADAKAAGVRLLEEVNELIGEPLVENYLVFDVAGLDAIEGLPPCDTTGLDRIDSMKARLRNAKAYAETLSSDGITDLIGEMSAYLSTEMKSGALIKIADKAERYQINPSIHIEREITADENGREYISLETDELFDVVFDIFYEVNPY